MPAVSELRVEITAATEKLRAELVRGTKAVQSFEGRVMGALGNISMRFATGFGVAIAVAMLNRFVHSVDAAADALGAMAYKADTLGLTSEYFQRLSAAAIEADVDTQTFEASMAMFTKQIALARTGTGKLVDGLKEVNPSLLETLRHTRNNEEALRALADAMSSTDSPTQRAIIATSAFGRSGLAMQRILGMGNEGIEEFADRAQKLGYVLDEHLVRNANAAGDRFQLAAAAINNQMQRALVDLMPAMADAAEGVAYLVTGINELLDTFRTTEHLSTDGLKTRLKDLREELTAVEQGATLGARAMEMLRNTIISAGTGGKVQVPLSQSKSAEELKADIGRLEKLLAERQQMMDKYRNKTTLPDDEQAKAIGGEEAAAQKREAALQQVSELHRKMLGATQQQAAAIEAEYNIELAKFRKLLDDKLISQQEFDAARADLARMSAQKLQEIDVNFKLITASAQAFGSQIESALSSAFDTGTLDAKEMFSAIYKEIALTAVRLYALQPLFGGGDVKGGGLFGQALGGLAGVFHNGGVAGGPAPMRAVDPRLFNGATRYHTGGVAGLAPGELPAILKRGEIVLPESAARGLAGSGKGQQAGGSAAPVVHFTVNTTDAGSFQRSEGQITAMLSRAVARGQRNR